MHIFFQKSLYGWLMGPLSHTKRLVKMVVKNRIEEYTIFERQSI